MPEDKTDMKPLVLRELQRHGNASRAARKADVSRNTIHRWMAEDRVFGAAAKAAIQEGKE